MVFTRMLLLCDLLYMLQLMLVTVSPQISEEQDAALEDLSYAQPLQQVEAQVPKCLGHVICAAS